MARLAQVIFGLIAILVFVIMWFSSQTSYDPILDKPLVSTPDVTRTTPATLIPTDLYGGFPSPDDDQKVMQHEAV